jgi:ABC-type spermidine/putrescine transport system permease subunit II
LDPAAFGWDWWADAFTNPDMTLQTWLRLLLLSLLLGGTFLFAAVALNGWPAALAAVQTNRYSVSCW